MTSGIQRLWYVAVVVVVVAVVAEVEGYVVAC